MKKKPKQEKAGLSPGVNRLRKLYRLVSYKIYQINILESSVYNSDDGNRLEGSINRENVYSTSIEGSASMGAYEKAMWNYYLLLEKILLSHLNEIQSGVKSQLLTRQIQQKLKLYTE
jgi:hypothetical protein